MYSKPNPDLVRKVTNGFGSMKAKKMISIKQRTMKIIMMDYANYLLNDAQKSPAEVKNMVMKAINKSIEMGVSTNALIDTLNKYIDKKTRKIDPLLKLHCAVTMETLDVTGEGESPDPTTLPDEVQEAAECGADCFGGQKPSLESLMGNVPEAQAKLYSAVGGSLCDQMFRILGNTIDPEYLSKR